MKDPSVSTFPENIRNTTKLVRTNVIKQNEKMSKYYNKSRLPQYFYVDDSIWISTANIKLDYGNLTRKLSTNFFAPVLVLEKISDILLLIDLAADVCKRYS